MSRGSSWKKQAHIIVTTSDLNHKNPLFRLCVLMLLIGATVVYNDSTVLVGQRTLSVFVDGTMFINMTAQERIEGNVSTETGHAYGSTYSEPIERKGKAAVDPHHNGNRSAFQNATKSDLTKNATNKPKSMTKTFYGLLHTGLKKDVSEKTQHTSRTPLSQSITARKPITNNTKSVAPSNGSIHMNATYQSIHKLKAETNAQGDLPTEKTKQSATKNKSETMADVSSNTFNPQKQSTNKTKALTSFNRTKKISNKTNGATSADGALLSTNLAKRATSKTKIGTKDSDSSQVEVTAHSKTKARVGTSPWTRIVPRLDVQAFPDWLQDYIDWHNQAQRDILSSDGRKSRNYSYIIYTCRKGGDLCSGTGNRQRGILALFLVAIITKRVFLMDVNNPIELSEILQPHLIQWDCDYYRNMSSSMNDSDNNPCHEKNGRVKNIRNASPNPLLKPTEFVKDAPTIFRVLANGPPEVDGIWRSPEMQQLLRSTWSNKQEKIPLPISAYKWLFHALFKPSQSLSDLVYQQQQQLGIVNSTYIGMHLRLGGGGAWKPGKLEGRYNYTILPSFLQLGHNFQKRLGDPNIPIVVVADDEEAKIALHKLDQKHVRYIPDTHIVHVDRSQLRKKKAALQGMLQVWADMLILAQSTCIVESQSSFPRLARRISTPDTAEIEHDRCFIVQQKGRLKVL